MKTRKLSKRLIHWIHTPDPHDALTFEGRHKGYGAWSIRRAYKANLIAGLGVMCFLLATVLYLPGIIHSIRKSKNRGAVIEVNLNDSSILRLQNVNLPPPEPPPLTKKTPNPNQQPVQAGNSKTVADKPEKKAEPSKDSIPLISENTSETDSLAQTHPPIFPGGNTALFAFIKENLKYPWAEKEMGMQGTVTIGFVVSDEGEIEDIEIIKDVSLGINREAERLLSLMPKWLPARQDGKNIDAPLQLAIPFVITTPEKQN